MKMFIVGVDCATKPNRTGIAFGFAGSGKPSIHTVALGSKSRKVVDQIEEHLPNDQPALLALDAPLGWPSALATELPGHSAGEPLRASPDHLFSRSTDRLIRETLKKRPLEVGADRIARTAHAALDLLRRLREKTRLTIPLAWQPTIIAETCAIEVYPAATLLARQIKVSGYKKPKGLAARRALLKRLSVHLEISAETELLEKSPDALDAAICVLAASDFLRGTCIPPSDWETARKEGWIWIKHPNS